VYRTSLVCACFWWQLQQQLSTWPLVSKAGIIIIIIRYRGSAHGVGSEKPNMEAARNIVRSKYK
jgi:hypothetical protein